MRLRHGSKAIVTVVDGTVISGRIARSWRWHVIRIVEATAYTSSGPSPAAGSVLVPWRSVMLAQEVTESV